MTKELKDLMYILGCALNGKKAEPEHKLDIDKIYDLAVSQGVWHIIFEAIPKEYNLSQYQGRFYTSVAKNISKSEFVKKTVAELENHGIECCYLKGITLARLYPSPECRISGDADILIDPAVEAEAIVILKSLGYEIKDKNINDHHIQAKHKYAGLLEVHTMLYSKITRDILLKGNVNYNEEYITVASHVGEIKTFGVNDGLIFLTAHYIKHFLNGNVTLRQMCDILLYMQHYKCEVDWHMYNSLIKELGYYKLIETIKEVGNIYLGMDFEVSQDTVPQQLLEDFEQVSINVYEKYCKKKTDMGKVQYAVYKNKNSQGEKLIKKIFPNREDMQRLGYKNTEKIWGLMPAYFIRAVRICLKMIKKRVHKSNPKEELLRELGMM